MLAIVALLILTGANAENHTNFTGYVERALSLVFGTQTWTTRAASCARTYGLAKCITAFNVYRADKALDSYEKHGGCDSVLRNDLRTFPWQAYANETDDEVTSKLSENTSKLLQLRSLKFTMIPGYEFRLGMRENGALNVDMFRENNTEQEVARGSTKKFRKRFYAILPLLLVPGLIMSAVLPFILPALKMMTIGAGMLNQMALTGAIFTLLRNNAFSDHYEKKVVYVNAGYKNEKRRPVAEETIHTHTFDDGYYVEDKEQHDIRDYAGTNEYATLSEDGNKNFVKQYYGMEDYEPQNYDAEEVRVPQRNTKNSRLKHKWW